MSDNGPDGRQIVLGGRVGQTTSVRLQRGSNVPGTPQRRWGPTRGNRFRRGGKLSPDSTRSRASPPPYLSEREKLARVTEDVRGLAETVQEMKELLPQIRALTEVVPALLEKLGTVPATVEPKEPDPEGEEAESKTGGPTWSDPVKSESESELESQTPHGQRGHLFSLLEASRTTRLEQALKPAKRDLFKTNGKESDRRLSQEIFGMHQLVETSFISGTSLRSALEYAMKCIIDACLLYTSPSPRDS